MLNKIWEGLTYKDGQFSKTAMFLSFGILIALILWPFQSIFAGSIVYGYTISEFSIANATGILTILSALYLGNHKIKGNITKDGVSFEQSKE